MAHRFLDAKNIGIGSENTWNKKCVKNDFPIVDHLPCSKLQVCM